MNSCRRSRTSRRALVFRVLVAVRLLEFASIPVVSCHSIVFFPKSFGLGAGKAIIPSKGAWSSWVGVPRSGSSDHVDAASTQADTEASSNVKSNEQGVDESTIDKERDDEDNESSYSYERDTDDNAEIDEGESAAENLDMETGDDEENDEDAFASQDNIAFARYEDVETGTTTSDIDDEAVEEKISEEEEDEHEGRFKEINSPEDYQDSPSEEISTEGEGSEEDQYEAFISAEKVPDESWVKVTGDAPTKNDAQYEAVVTENDDDDLKLSNEDNEEVDALTMDDEVDIEDGNSDNLQDEDEPLYEAVAAENDDVYSADFSNEDDEEVDALTMDDSVDIGDDNSDNLQDEDEPLYEAVAAENDDVYSADFSNEDDEEVDALTTNDEVDIEDDDSNSLQDEDEPLYEAVAAENDDVYSADFSNEDDEEVDALTMDDEVDIEDDDSNSLQDEDEPLYEAVAAENDDVYSADFSNEDDTGVGDIGVNDDCDIIEDDDSNSLQDTYQEVQARQPLESLAEDENAYEAMVSVDSNDDLVTPEKSQTGTEENWEEETADVHETEASFGDEAVIEIDNPSIGSNSGSTDLGTDDDSAAFVDRMDLADAEDEGESTTGGFGYNDSLGGDMPENDSSDAPDEDERSVGETEKSSPTSEPSTSDAPNEDEPSVEETEKSTPSSESSTLETNSKPSVSIVIDETMRKILIKELGYCSREVSSMKPGIIGVVAAKRLRRPNEGMPLQWYKEGTKNKLIEAVERAVLSPIVKSGLLGGVLSLVLVQNKGGFDFSFGTNSLEKEESEDEDDKSIPPVLIAGDPSWTVPRANEDADDYDPFVHSVVPNSKKLPPRKDDTVDVTWMDKALSTIENQFMSAITYANPLRLLKKD